MPGGWAWRQRNCEEVGDRQGVSLPDEVAATSLSGDWFPRSSTIWPLESSLARRNVRTMPQASLNALLVAYRAEIDWLLSQAIEFESGARKVSGRVGGKEVDLSPNIAAEYRHKAGNMHAILAAYERLHSKGA